MWVNKEKNLCFSTAPRAIEALRPAEFTHYGPNDGPELGVDALVLTTWDHSTIILRFESEPPPLSIYLEEKKMNEKNCKACKYSYMEPDDNLTCGHPDSGTWGLYVYREPAKHCGDERTKFEQHPLRNPDGSLKSVKA